MVDVTRGHQAKAPSHQQYAPLAAFLSYLIPGLGQVSQGRVGKGILFFVCIYALFFYGMYLGQWNNVFLPDVAEQNNPWNLPRLPANLYNRPQFMAQFWVGLAAWPAIAQYNAVERDQVTPPLRFIGTFMRTPDENRLNDLQRDSDKSWDLGWIFTVIAGALNVLVIYDALAGPAYVATAPTPPAD